MVSGRTHEFDAKRGFSICMRHMQPLLMKQFLGLTEFTELVGKEKALELTQSIRIREELEMDRVMRELENGKQMYD